MRGNLGLSQPYSVHCATAGHCENAITALGVTQDFPSSISQVEMYDICIAFPTESLQLKARKAKKPSLMYCSKNLSHALATEDAGLPVVSAKFMKWHLRRSFLKLAIKEWLPELEFSWFRACRF